MNVPNYIPEQIEVPGNVTEQKQFLRVLFLRNVSLKFLVSAFLLIALIQLPWPKVSAAFVFLGWLSMVIVADLLRILHRGEDREAKFAAGFLPLLLLGLAWFFALFPEWWPAVVAPLTGICCWVIYAWVCGRDFSFVGCFLLSLIASSVVLAMASIGHVIPKELVGHCFASNAAVLLYGLYDLASIQSRRRVGEQWAAVADLYRDFLNIFGYVPRVIRYWRKYPFLNINR